MSEITTNLSRKAADLMLQWMTVEKELKALDAQQKSLQTQAAQTRLALARALLPDELKDRQVVFPIGNFLLHVSLYTYKESGSVAHIHWENGQSPDLPEGLTPTRKKQILRNP